MSLNNVLRNILEDVEGALGCGVVDLNTGLILGACHNVPYFTQSYLDAVGAAAVDMLRGRNVSAVYKMLAAQRGDGTIGRFYEIQMTSDNTYHFLATVEGKPDALMVLVTSKRTNLGMGWSALRGAMADIAPLCP